MIVPGGNGWLVTLTDLALILFMITARALSQSEPADITKPHQMVGAPMLAEPVAIFRPDGNAGSLRNWLASQSADPRQRMTIRVSYPDGGDAAAAGQALQLAQEARANGREPRIVLENGGVSDVSISLAYDSDPIDVARQLHSMDSSEPSNGPKEKP
jgi:hypothetical protein